MIVEKSKCENKKDVYENREDCRYAKICRTKLEGIIGQTCNIGKYCQSIKIKSVIRKRKIVACPEFHKIIAKCHSEPDEYKFD